MMTGQIFEEGPNILLENNENEKGKEKITIKEVKAEDIKQAAEGVIRKLLEEELEKYMKKEPETFEVNDICLDRFLDEGIEFLGKKICKFLAVMQKPLRKNPLEILAKIQQKPYIYNPLKWVFTGYPPILPLSFSEELSCYLSSNNPSETKLFFDCCNEFLQQYRPFTTKGAPMPWQSHLKQYRKPSLTPTSLTTDLKSLISQANSIHAGRIPENLSFSTSTTDNEKLHNNREEKIGILITQDIKNTEEQWVDYLFEETQTALNLADGIFSMLIDEIFLLGQLLGNEVAI
jgi:hypothetical protein